MAPGHVVKVLSVNTPVSAYRCTAEYKILSDADVVVSSLTATLSIFANRSLQEHGVLQLALLRS